MASKAGKAKGTGRIDCKLVLAVAALGFTAFLLACALGLGGLQADTFALADGGFLSLVTIFCLWKFDEIEKRLGR